MKALCKIFSLLMLFTLTFVSCSDDDDDKKEHHFDGSYTSKSEIYGNSNVADLTINGDDIAINRMFPTYEGKFNKAKLAYNQAYMEVTGLNGKDVSLNDFTIIVNGKSFLVGIVNADAKFNNNDHIKFLDETLGQIIKDQKLQVKIKFRPSKDIAATDNIKLNLHYAGTFYYMK